jgi:lipopolysaccharide heptosyltransferase II
MNILQILPSLDVGGVETGTVDLARYLVSNGHKAIVVSSGGRLVREIDKIGARHYSLPVDRKSLFTIIRMIGALREIIRKEDIDIVHARSRVPALAAYFACRETSRVFVTTAHGYYKKHFLSTPMSWGKYVIVASNIMARHMRDNFGVPHDRIKLIPRGVDLERFRLRSESAREASREFAIGMVSRITPLKGHADFIRAVSMLNRQIPKLKVLIVGSAPKEKYKDDLKLLIRGFGLSKTVEFIEATNDVPAVMSRLDCLVLATVTPEAFGRVIIEAHAVGVPVVATKVGGVVDIIEDGRTGLLCAPNDPKDMADKIMSLYRDSSLGARLASEGRHSVEEKYNLDLMMKRTMALYEHAFRTQNILVIKMSAIGDVILAVPSLKAIRAGFPDANIKVLIGAQAREVLEHCPYINEKIVCDFKGVHRSVRGLWRLAKELQRQCFDIVIDLQNNNRSHALSSLSMAPLRYGYDNRKLAFFLNKKVKDDAPYLDPLEHQFRVLRLAGIKPIDKKLELRPSAEDEAAAEKFLADNWVKPTQSLAGINMRASAKWITKNWPGANIAWLCDAIAKETLTRVVLTGTKDDARLANNISKLAKSKPIIAAGKTSIAELACLIRRFKVFLTPDSAPLHIAQAVGTPVVALFGPTDPARHVVPSGSCTIIHKNDEVKCAPCYSPTCMKNFRCMKAISVDEIYQAMRAYLHDKSQIQILPNPK